MPIVARRVEHRNERHNIALDRLNDSVWKGSRKDPSDLPLAFAKSRAQRIFRHFSDAILEGPNESRGKPGLLSFIPGRRLLDVDEGARE